MTPNSSTRRPGSFRSQGTAATLTAVSVYAVIAAGTLWWVDGLPTLARLPLALPLLLVAPGYAVVAALFPTSVVATRTASADGSPPGQPSQAGVTALERGILAVAASIAIVPIVALATAAVAGIAVGPILAGIAGITVLASGIAIVRSPAEEAIAVRRSDGRRESGRGSLDPLPTDGVTQLAIALAAILLVASAAFALTGSPGDPSMTEFYLVNETGTPSEGASGSSNVAGDPTTEVFDLRITHHGEEPQRYTIVVLLERTDGSDSQTASGSLVELRRSSRVVGSGEAAAETYRVDEEELVGTSKVLFLLYEGDAPATPEPGTAHRTLELSVNVTDE